VGLTGGDVERWQPNFIDYRSSVANVDRRRDHGETVETCSGCGCEADLEPVPHYPGGPTSRACPALAAGVSAGAVDGRALLDRMDAGEPLREVEPEIDIEALLDVDDVLEQDDELDDPEESGELSSGSVPDQSSSAPAERRPHRARGQLLKEVMAALELGPQRLADLAALVGYSSENIGGWLLPHVKSGKIVRVERGVYALPGHESGREPMADAEGPGGVASVSVSAPPASEVGEEPSRPENEQARRRAWEKAEIIDAIQRWRREYGEPPTSTEWARHIEGYPTTSTVKARFGSWANAIEAAGFPRPTRGGVPLKPAAAPAKRVRVRGTGLTYATPEEAYMAADEIENDGQRVAEQARFDGNEPKAEQAIDQSRALAEKIRDAAHAFEARERENGVRNIHENIHETSPEKGVEVSLPHAYARALIAGMRAAADALEHELDR